MKFHIRKLSGFSLYVVAFHSCRGRCDGELSQVGSLSFDEMLWIVAGLLRGQTRDAESAPGYDSDDLSEWTLTLERQSASYWIVTDHEDRFALLQDSEALAFVAGRGRVRYRLQSYEEWHRDMGRFYPKPIALIPHLVTA